MFYTDYPTLNLTVNIPYFGYYVSSSLSNPVITTFYRKSESSIRESLTSWLNYNVKYFRLESSYLTDSIWLNTIYPLGNFFVEFEIRSKDEFTLKQNILMKIIFNAEKPILNGSLKNSSFNIGNNIFYFIKALIFSSNLRLEIILKEIDNLGN
jgi:hypothetical protein